MSIPLSCFPRAFHQIQRQHHQDGTQHDHQGTQELPSQKHLNSLVKKHIISSILMLASHLSNTMHIMAEEISYILRIITLDKLNYTKLNYTSKNIYLH